ncbi:hypothetical protein SAMD00019534_105480 [Acytostelium subglobosum LB1]|uniref:hypothetical protein n=1 Tax=Acytostelium subglobosum LB1 TaxID=1410327 RepID=UPI00064504B7|nr:hypothetical protein SAMD00019534_105480 [Acytostelium subglobosum LB1]GAM27373.1 hypothetical protein SAMD00019534_105480 [Acytostelium subglobosum LB1]|eukprot:XP_012749840.1 hypothetical protein SAMD00019534_105480 [Acytostelium subglobosum LB1]
MTDMFGTTTIANYVIDSDDLDVEGWHSVKVDGRVPQPRHAHTCTLIGDIMWIFGGYGLGGIHLGDLSRIDLRSGRWERIKHTTKLPARHSHTAVSYAGDLWIFGGIGTGSADNVYNDLWRYAPADDTWTKMVPAQGYTPEARWGHAAVIYQGAMYVFGGMNEGFYNNVLRYDFAANEWTNVAVQNTQVSPVPHGRQYHGMALVGSRIYVFGGYDGLVCPNDMYELNLDTLVWRGIVSASGRHTIRRGAVTVAHGSVIYQFGGRFKNLTDSMLRFDTTTLEWREVTLANRPSKRQFAAGVIYNDNIYVFGGQSDYNENDIHRYQLPQVSAATETRGGGGSGSGQNVSKVHPTSPSSLLASNFGQLVDNPMYSDIQFKVDGRTIHAHRCILYSRNEHFKAMITSGMKETVEDIIHVPDTTYDAFRAIVHYLYTGQLRFRQIDLLELLSLSDRYLIKEVKEQCAKYLVHVANKANMDQMRHLADTYNIDELKAKVATFEDGTTPSQ